MSTLSWTVDGATDWLLRRLIPIELEFVLDSLSSYCCFHRREWINGGWVPPLLTTQNDAIHKETGGINKAKRIYEFSKGALVEARIEEDGFQGDWFTASIIKATEKGKYILRYHKLRRDDDKDFVGETVDENRIRPSPLEAIIVDVFTINDEVHAYLGHDMQGSWLWKVWSYFDGTEEDAIFEHFKLRTHQDWVDGAWSGSRRD